MKLKPYESLSYRREKVLRHVFHPGERWWEIGGNFREWHNDWSALQREGCFAVEAGWLVAERSRVAAAILDRHHEAWLSAAEHACDQAAAAGRVYPAERGRSCYVGEGGVTVYVSPAGDLVTCFRPCAATGSALSLREGTERAEQRARRKSGGALRTAVRRRERRTSLRASAGSSGDRGERT